MPPSLNKLLDPTGWRIVRELQQNARASLTELGRKINLSTPAVVERVRKLEDAGIITGYHAHVDADKLGLPMLVFIRINTPTREYARFLKIIDQSPEVLECHHVAGADSFVLKARLASNAHLEALLRRMSAFGETNTSIVLSSPITGRHISPEALAPTSNPSK